MPPTAPASPATPVASERPVGMMIAGVLLTFVNVLHGMLMASPEGGLVGPRALGAGSVSLILAGIAYGLGALSARRPNRNRRGWTVLVVVMALVTLADRVGGQRSAATQPLTTLTEAERSGLEFTSGGIRHPLLGFSAPHPGAGFQVDSAGQRVANEQTRTQAGRMQVWAFARDDPFGVALVQVVTGLAPTESDFRDFAGGMRGRMKNPSVGRTLVDTLIWMGDRKEFRFAIQHAESGAIVRWRCLPSPAGRPKAYIVCAMSSALDSASVSNFIDGLATTDRP